MTALPRTLVNPGDRPPGSGAVPEGAPQARQRRGVRDLLRHVAERSAAEEELGRTRLASEAAIEQEYERTRQALDERSRGLREGLRRADEQRRRTIVEAAIAGEGAAKADFAKASRRIASEFDGVREQAKGDLGRARAAAQAAFEKGERAAASQFAEEKRPIDEALKVIASMRGRLDAISGHYRKYGLSEITARTVTVAAREGKGVKPIDDLFDRLAKAEPPLKLLEELLLPRALKGSRYLWLFAILFLLLVPVAAWWGGVVGAVAAAGTAVALGFVLRVKLYGLAKLQVDRLRDPVAQTLAECDALAGSCRATADDRLKAERGRVTQQRDAALQQAKEAHARTITGGESRRDERLRQINEEYAHRITEIQTRQQVDLRDAIALQVKHADELEAQVLEGTRKVEEKYERTKEKFRSHHEGIWTALATRWREGAASAYSTLEAVRREALARGPDWDDPSWGTRPLPADVPAAIRLGTVRVDLDRLPGGTSADPRLMEGIPSGASFPALLPFPDGANLMIEAPGEGRAAAMGVLQAVMSRLLTSLPPGQVRFTIIDPIGIGRGFGAFMHLADYDEALVTRQVWTEPRQIEERLADLSAHMEKVTQRYLRNEYATIGEYNAVAGEVAEPYRVLVVADFPASFDEKSAARLASIMAGGIPCGVITLLAIDVDRPLPSGVAMADFRASAARLAWRDGRLEWDDPDFGPHLEAIDPPPGPEAANRIIHRVGAAARDSRRVVVPFEFIAPSEDAWWALDSRAGIDVPLGKAGATKRQNLSLGQGTSQHVLLAGRTGSGKSTLLHALITNLALNYSPDEIELYLIDFKKGVEFKVYAAKGLPHAGVVAIESEREFGISVLQRLDAEMQSRGERFREAGVQDVNGYRNAPGSPPLPRMLLIVDEFQEFFVEEDKLAQEAAGLLDRLVRQGRAFGIHAILGSQSLGGAFALARTTLGQMAVRIALQCSDVDAHLILSEQNAAAEMLSRPGEAVYNDANGQAEGNHFFQVVWLGDDRREDYLDRLRERAREHPPRLVRTPIVFEGDGEADPARNPLLAAKLALPAWPSSPRSALAWLGDPVAIRDPVAALFRRQGGNHLLIVGQNDKLALGILATALVGLASQYPPSTSDMTRSGAKFVVLDGTPEDEPRAGLLARVAGTLPHEVEVGVARDVPRLLAAVAAEVERRQQPDADGPELYVLVHDLPRFRDLRRRENDFGFSRRDEEAGPADHFGTILREGPVVGVHLLVWCDNLTNLNRHFEHQTLREFESRVLFQMSPNDSGHLLDAPHASKLGPHRAYFASEEQNRLEKFRPYGLPTEEWLESVAARFRDRAAGIAGGDPGSGG